MDRDSQIKAIEKTFEDNKKTIERHYSKPNVVPVEILPVYPDFKVLLQQCLNVNVIPLSSICLFNSNFSCGNIHVLKLYLTLILRQLVALYLRRSKKCLKL